MNNIITSFTNQLAIKAAPRNFALFLGLFLLIARPAYAQWSELGGLDALGTKNRIQTVCSDKANNIYAAGTFSHGFNSNYYVAKYNGSTWSELGGINSLAANGYINTLCTDVAGNIYAAGEFINSNGDWYVAKYNGTSWSELGGLSGLAANGSIHSICSDPAGNIYAAGWFTNGSARQYVAKYNGSTWTELGGINALAANASIYSLHSDVAGKIYAGGDFRNAAGKTYIATYNGTAWSELGGVSSFNSSGAINGSINSICSDRAGNIYASGSIQDTTGMDCVVQYKSGSWSILGGAGSLVSGLNGSVLSLCSDTSGNIYAGGAFTNSNATGKHYQYVARYNGSAWSELGGLSALKAGDVIYAICSDPAGNIYATGNFGNVNRSAYVARYGPSMPLGLSNPVNNTSIVIYPNPVMNQISVETADKWIGSPYSMYDNTGKTVLSGRLQSVHSVLDVRNIPSGVYTICVGADSRQAVRFIKR